MIGADFRLALQRMARAPVLIRRHRLWPTVSVAVLLRRVEKRGELHLLDRGQAEEHAVVVPH